MRSWSVSYEIVPVPEHRDAWFLGEPMVTTRVYPQERIAHEELSQHSFSGTVDQIRYRKRQEFPTIVEVAEPARIELVGTVVSTLSQWCEYAHEGRGYRNQANIDHALVQDSIRGVPT